MAQKIKARDVHNETPLEAAQNVPRNTEGVIRVLMEHAANFFGI